MSCALSFAAILALAALTVVLTRVLTPRGLRWSLPALSLAALLPMPGLAAEVAGATAVDLTPLVQAVVAAAAGTVPALATALYALLRSHLKRRFGLELDARSREVVLDAAERWADWGEAMAKRHLNANRLTVDVHSGLLAQAVNGFTAAVPDGLAQLGVTREGAERMLLNRLAARGVLPPDGLPAVPALAASRPQA